VALCCSLKISQPATHPGILTLENRGPAQLTSVPSRHSRPVTRRTRQPCEHSETAGGDFLLLTDGPPFCEHVFLLGVGVHVTVCFPVAAQGSLRSRSPRSTALLLLSGNMRSARVTNESKIRYPSGHLNGWSKDKRVPARLHPAKPDQSLFPERSE
jgi:hypothetical protein